MSVNRTGCIISECEVSSIRNSRLQPVPWKTLDVVLGLALVIAAFVGGIVVLAIVQWVTGADPESGLGFAILAGVVGCLLVLASWLAGPGRHGASMASLGLKLAVPRLRFQLLLPVLVFVASLIFSVLYVSLVSNLPWDFLAPDPPLEEFDVEGPAVITGFAFVVVLWGPLAEEVFFRGFIFSGLSGRLGITGAAVASSLLFALFHFDPRVMVPIFATGMLLAWLYHRTGSLWSCLAAHALQNGLVVVIALWPRNTDTL